MSMTVPTATGLTTTADNRPPLITSDDLRSEFAGLSRRLTELMKTSANCPPTIDDDETSGTWQEFIKDADKDLKAIEANRVNTKEPYLAAGRVVDGYFRDVYASFNTVRATVASRVQDYLQRKANAERLRLQEQARLLRLEEERRQQEAADAAEAARKAQERNRPKEADTKQFKADVASQQAEQVGATAAATEKMAAGKSADLSRTRSAGGALGTLGDHWDFKVDDMGEVKGQKLWAYVTAGAKEQAIRAYMKANAPKAVEPGQTWDPLPGVTFFRTTKLQVR